VNRVEKEFKIIKKDKGKDLDFFDKNRMFQYVNSLKSGTEKKEEGENKVEDFVPINQIAIPTPAKGKSESKDNENDTGLLEEVRVYSY